MINVTRYIGEVHPVSTGGREMTVTIADGGTRRLGGRDRQILALTVEFTDGRRSHWASADAGAGEVAAKLLAPYSVGMLGGDGWEPLVERSQRDKGKRRNGSTIFTFFVLAYQMPSREERERELAEVAARFAAAMAEIS